MGERPVVGAVELLDDLVLRRLLRVAEDLLDAPPVVEEVLLEERDDLALEAPDQLLRRSDVHQVAVPEHVVAVEQRLDPRVHRLQERLEVDPVEVVGKELGPWHHPAEGEAPPQRRIHQGDRAVGHVHRPDDEEVRRDGDALAAVGKLRLLLVPLPQPLARLEERDELAERLREIRAVDLVDDEDAVRGLPAEWSVHTRAIATASPPSTAWRTASTHSAFTRAS